MIPRIETLNEKKIIGKRMTMTFIEDKTFELWRSFMPRRREIKNPVSSELFSIKVYKPDFNFTYFDLKADFDKWAGIEVQDFSLIPEGMESLILPEGLYAVFNYKGPASKGAETFKYIFTEWLPKSEYQIDNRPHFEILGEKYKNDDPQSEEEVWIPINPKK